MHSVSARLCCFGYQNTLDNIAGSGPTTKRKLLRHFGSLTRLKGALQHFLAHVTLCTGYVTMILLSHLETFELAVNEACTLASRCMHARTLNCLEHKTWLQGTQRGDNFAANVSATLLTIRLTTKRGNHICCRTTTLLFALQPFLAAQHRQLSRMCL